MTTEKPTIETQIKDLSTTTEEITTQITTVKGLSATVKALQDQNAQMAEQLDQLRRQAVVRASLAASPRLPGSVTDECARELAARVILHYERNGRLDAVCSVPAERDKLLHFSRAALGISARAALTTSEIPLPSHYSGQIRELISEFGIARRRMTHYPIGMGTAKPARMGARPAFGSIVMSAAIAEKSPSFSFASLESHKVGGIVCIPRELDEQSIVSIGQFLARYGAIEFARLEDQWAFLADGTPDFEGVKGIVTSCSEAELNLSLATGKTKPSDATLDDFRNLRLKANKAALSGRLSAYYLDSTWEAKLPAFKSASEPDVYYRRPDGTAVLDGYPIVWTDVLTPYGTTAAPGKPIAVFGALSYWWFGEHGSPRIDTSDHVYFKNDQLAVRFIEEIDFDYVVQDAAAALLTAAS